MSEVDALTFAIVAVALAPTAYWVLGPHNGFRRIGTSSPWLRRGLVAAWAAAIVLAVCGALAS